jgi:hypothetical protein
MKAISLSFDKQLGPHNSHVGQLCVSNPKFHSIFAWSVDDETLRVMVIVSLGHDISQVTSMEKLCHCKTAYILEIQCLLNKFLVELSSQEIQRLIV